MKRNAIRLQPVVLLIVMGAMLLSIKNAFAQNPAVKAIYTTQQDYSLHYQDEKESGTLDCTVEATFINTSPEKFIVKVTKLDTNDSINLSFNYPLNYEYFYSIITQKLQSKYGIFDRFLNEDINAIYNQLFLLTIAKDYDDVNSGTLYLNRWAMVMRGNRRAYSNSYDDNQYSKRFGNTIEREHKLDSVGSNTFVLDKSVAAMANHIDHLLDSVIMTKFGLREYINDTVQKYNKKRFADSLVGLQAGVLAANLEKLYKQTGDSAKEQTGINDIDTIIKRLGSSSDSIAKRSLLEDDKNQRIATLKNIKDNLSLLHSKIKTDNDTLLDLKVKLTNAGGTLDSSKNQLIIKYDSQIDAINKVNQAKLFLQRKEIPLLRGAIESFGDDKGGLYSILDTNIVDYERDYKKLIEIKQAVRELDIYKIKDISLQFERGYLERIQVTVEKGYSTYVFENIYAIGMSSVYNFKQFSNIKLYIRKSVSVSGDYIYLSDVIQNYQNLLDLYTRDYSPADTVINHIDPAIQPAFVLRKEKLINLFDARIYTDLVGLKADQPNGLVQIEMNKRFNIITQRQQLLRADMGIFNSINIYGGLSKIEENMRSLALRNAGVVENNKLISPYYATGLDFRQYENLHFGADLNLLLFDYPDGKFTFYVNMGYRYGHTSVIDSNYSIHADQSVTFSDQLNNLDAHTLTWELVKLKLELFSERRLGLTIGYQYNVATLYSNNQFKQIVSYEKSAVENRLLESNAGKYHIFDMNVRLETSRTGNGRLFLRGRYFFQKGDVQSFFAQLQVGYAYNLIFRK